MPITRSGSSSRWALLALAAAACTPAPGASQAADGGPPADAAAPAPTASESAEARGADEIRPVYPVDAGPPDPLAARFCDAVVALPERRRAECCSSSAAMLGLLRDQCVRTLSFALGQHAVTLAPADVDRCADAVTRATAGCDWVTLGTAALPAACEGVIKGALAAKAQCRSSLECAGGQRCLDLSAIDLGTCGDPKPLHGQCNVAVDVLAAFTRQELDRTHPECAGHCVKRACEDAVPPGGACVQDGACGGGARCDSGKCTTAKLPALGEACTGSCVEGARCVKGTCAAPRAEGDACEADAECRGACVRGDGGAAGSCVKSCPVYTMPARPAPSDRAPVGRPGVPPPRRR